MAVLAGALGNREHRKEDAGAATLAERSLFGVSSVRGLRRGGFRDDKLKCAVPNCLRRKEHALPPIHAIVPLEKHLMSRTLFFHVGAHKTATTLVQLRLRDRKRHLLRSGVRLIDPNDLHGSPLERFIEGRKDVSLADASLFFQQLVGDGQSVQNAIAVFEDLLGKIDLAALYPKAEERTRRLVECVHAADASWQVRPALVVRRLDTYWYSCFRHDLKSGRVRDFGSSLDGLRNLDPSWRPVVEGIEAAVGHSIPVRRYEDLNGLSDEDFTRQVLGMGGSLCRTAVQPVRSVSSLKRRLRSLLHARWKLLSSNPNSALSERGILLAQNIRPIVTIEEWRKHFRPLLSNHFSRLHDKDVGIFRLPESLLAKLVESYQDDTRWFADRLELAYSTGCPCQKDSSQVEEARPSQAR